ncbi:MAG: serine/threonine protein kinase, partial [Planctomycetes bacterium]|nr:serine/threonine protein kinase [Planctomycetota bacterium]
VYKAHQTFMDQTVALKVIRPELGRDRNFRERFLVEVKNASRVRHPNAVQILDAGESEEGLVYMAMEYVEGESLTDLIGQHAAGMPLDLFRKLAGQMCAALAAVHEKGIIHRDLKPDNILIQNENAGPQVKLLDFGISKLIQDPLDQEADTQAPTILGAMTPEYASPEQKRRERVTTASDLYSLGVILHEILTGRRPEPEGGAQPSELRGDLGLVVAKALHEEPARRY